MSVNFEKPMNDAAKSQLKELFGEHVVQDNYKTLYDRMGVLEVKKMSRLARTAEQPVSVELNDIGDTKKMSDGSTWILTEDGWKTNDNDTPIESESNHE